MRNVHDSHTHLLSATNYLLTHQYTLIYAALYLLQPVALLGFNDRIPGVTDPYPQRPSMFS